MPRADVALGYGYIRSNAPPDQAPKFSASGGFGAFTYHVWYWLGATGEIAGVHADHISSFNQNLTLITYQGGPRVMGHFGPVTLFAQSLAGAARGSDSYFPTSTGYTTSTSGLAG